MRAPETRIPDIGFLTPLVKFLSEALRTTITSERLMALHVHKEQIDILDLDKVGEGYVSGREDTLRKFGLFL